MTTIALTPATMNVAQAAQVGGMSTETMLKAISGGMISAVRIGRKWFIPRARFAEFLHITEAELDARLGYTDDLKAAA